jgi:two-component system alkaline phosphatase synthesis response regulator PhoP
MMKRPRRPVLLVEDHQDTRDMVETFLRHEGYTVVTAGNGVEALLAVDRDAPCIILLDVMMPLMDGPTFARHLRQLPNVSAANTPIVLLTATANVAPLQKDVGAREVLRKPISFEAIAAALERHCVD